MQTLLLILLHSEIIKIGTVPSESPFHPFLVHFPIAFTFLIPFLSLGVLYIQKKLQISEEQLSLWNIIIIFNIVNLIFSYFALFSGDIEHELLENSPFLKQTIEQHETFAESFFVLQIIITAVSVLGHVNFSFYKIMRIFFMILYFLLAIPIISYTGYLGGKIVYELDAPFFRKKLLKQLQQQKQSTEELEQHKHPEKQSR